MFIVPFAAVGGSMRGSRPQLRAELWQLAGVRCTAASRHLGQLRRGFRRSQSLGVSACTRQTSRPIQIETRETRETCERTRHGGKRTSGIPGHRHVRIGGYSEAAENYCLLLLLLLPFSVRWGCSRGTLPALLEAQSSADAPAVPA